MISLHVDTYLTLGLMVSHIHVDLSKMWRPYMLMLMNGCDQNWDLKSKLYTQYVKEHICKSTYGRVK